MICFVVSHSKSPLGLRTWVSRLITNMFFLLMSLLLEKLSALEKQCSKLQLQQWSWHALKSNARHPRKIPMSCITSETELIIYECVVCCKRRMKDSFSASSSATALGRRREGSYEVHFDLCPVKLPVLCMRVYFTQATTFWTISLDFM